MPQQGRKVLFFLGAGASVSAGAVTQVQHGGKIPIPTQATFWPTFLRFCRHESNRKEIESFLFRYFLGYKKVPTRLGPGKRGVRLSNVNVEEVFTFVSERVNALSTSPQLRTYAESVWKALVAEISVVFGRYQPNKNTKQIYRKFLRQYIKRRDAVVSFNYDTIFENSIPKNRKWCYEGKDQGNNALRILKPHGSINWVAKKSDSGFYIAVEDNPNQSVVVAPTHLKFVKQNSTYTSKMREVKSGYLDQSSDIQTIWATMEKEMRQSKALVFIGYSFPDADLYFSSVLRSVLASRETVPAVVIVNPDAVAIRDRLRTRFPTERIRLYYDLTTFLQLTRRQMLM